MSNSYRIRTELGVDKSVQVYLDQDFEFLEILSLKILQSQIYTRPCSDYGVIVGRISVNNGFGIPNAKVSVFIPITQEDENNPVILELYPYKNVTDVNEDGYRYNLLPYVQQYGGHTPTGTFPDRSDVLTNPTLIEVFDKYYKYTARTNDSGDYMIFGVPLGTQTVHIDIDLSDIGEFSLSPQDLVRMGRANENQIAGTRFRASTNLGELPQIISINRTVQVEPLWGDSGVCNLGITREDFDLTDGLNLKIEPTAIFMGSIVSNSDNLAQKRNCKPRLRQGKQCSLVAGPGEILAIRQTIFQDVNGRPGLERHALDSGGQVIDDNGTWLVDVPMNLDYVVTNEFGQQVISDDPKKGIPTKGRYRFKVKWNQSPSLREPIKRGYFLVPNVKECGWLNTSPFSDPLISPAQPSQVVDAVNSYAFSLDWNDYGDTGTTVGQQMILEAITCEDRFYEFTYNKVYTVSQFIDQFRTGTATNRIIAIKDILDDTCESENNKFPTNDATFRFDILYLLALTLFYSIKPTLLVVLLALHILAFLSLIVGFILSIIITVVFWTIWLICKFFQIVVDAINSIPGVNASNPLGPCQTVDDYNDLINIVTNLYKYFTNYNLPLLTYPDCELCDCSEGQSALPGQSPPPPPSQILTTPPSVITNTISQYQLNLNYSSSIGVNVNGANNYTAIASLMSGPAYNPSQIWSGRAPQSVSYGTDSSGNNVLAFTSSLPLFERINLFNTKAKFYDTEVGGGVNQIKVSFNIDGNNPSVKYHYDNVLLISCRENTINNFAAGNIITFQNPQLSTDPNLTGLTSLNQYGTPSATGSTLGVQFGTGTGAYFVNNVNLSYADPTNPSLTPTVTYTITGKTDDALYHKYPIDIEYFQVITAMTYSTYSGLTNNSLPNSLATRFLLNDMKFEFLDKDTGCWYNTTSLSPINSYTNGDKQILVFLVRGVDPYATRNKNRYDLNKLFGYSTFGSNPNLVIEGMYKPNIPIQPRVEPIRHNNFSSDVFTTSSLALQYGGQLYFESFHYQPSQTGNGQFTAFTSNLPNYYSSINNTSTPLSLGGSIANLGTITNPTPVGLTIKPSYVNGFNREYTFSRIIFDTCPPGISTCTTYDPVNNGTTVNRGYFDNENVDGGSVMGQYFNSTYLSCVACCGPYDIPGTYFTSKYSSTYTYPNSCGTNGRQIVMRSDRLPTSTSLEGNDYPLQSNTNFLMFYVGDQGLAPSPQGTQTSGAPNFGGVDLDQPEVADTAIFDSFTCQGLVPLDCYEEVNGEIKIKPPGDLCYKTSVPTISILNFDLSKPTLYVEKGCYKLITSIFFSLFFDFRVVTEWTSRMLINFAACRNVWAHMFTNNWINGTLYAFAINNDRFYTSPSATPPSQPYSAYCRKTVFLHPTNNYYYRSSPYDVTNGFFIGGIRPFNIFGSYGGNDRNILFPTTIMDLGPKNLYVQELVMSDKYDGYVVNKVPTTTYGDVEEILNLFIINRLTNTSFLALFFGAGGANIKSYFSRNKNMVDADYAQSISVNSELGVAPFQAENYPANPSGQDPIYVNSASSSVTDRVFGIFFSSDTQIRDWISPKRTINVSSGLTNNQCTFNNYGTFSQVVPFYQWGFQPSSNIFGTQLNDWYTSPSVISSSSFLQYRYQSMDRLLSQCRYFRPVNPYQMFYKGHIYSVTQASTPLTYDLSPSPSDWSQNSPLIDQITVGAPFYFYFGLKKGKSAWDRFASKYLDLETVENDG